MGTPTLRKQLRHVIAALYNSLSQSKDLAWYRRSCVTAPTVERLPRVCLLLTLLSRIGKSSPRPNRGKTTAQLTYHSHLRHLRGQENLSVYSQVATIASGHSMANHFCKTCGTLMYRVGGGFPGCSILRLGTVDDFNLVETKLKPQSELFIKDRVGWFNGVQGDEVKRLQAMS